MKKKSVMILEGQVLDLFWLI